MDRCLVVAFACCWTACFVDLGGGDTAATTGAATTTMGTTTETGAETSGGLGTTTEDPTTGAADSTGLIKPLMCGNGVQDSNEDCDDGNNMSGDGCSAECLIEDSLCGDEILDPGEGCDDGNLIDGDGCSSLCVLETGCGDGVKLASEQCDDGNLDPLDGCDDKCELNFLYVFVTANLYDGALGGVGGADARCQMEAAGKLPGTYRAWIASSADDRPATRFATVEDVQYRLADRTTTIVAEFSGLNEDIQHPINKTAEGMIVAVDSDACEPARSVWTGLDGGGNVMANGTCLGWQSVDPNDRGFSGYLDSMIIEWTAACLATCERLQRLYCFQQAP